MALAQINGVEEEEGQQGTREIRIISFPACSSLERCSVVPDNCRSLESSAASEICLLWWRQKQLDAGRLVCWDVLWVLD